MCQVASTGTVLFYKFKPENQPAVKILSQAIIDKVSAVHQVIYAIVAQYDTALVSQLMKTETPENLNAFGKIMGAI